MKKFIRVAVYEYTRHVFRLRFLVTLISIPLLLAVLGVAMFFSMLPEMNFQPVGYVDHSGLIDGLGSSDRPTSSRPAPIRGFENEYRADQALYDRQIQAYFVLEKDYLLTREARLVSRKPLSTLVQLQFIEFVRDQLLASQPAPIANRLRSSGEIIVRSLDGSRQVGTSNLLTYFVPMLGAFALIFASFTASGYLMHAIIEERVNRTMEILITSLSPWQLIGGKTVGLTGVGLTQLFFWTAPIWLLIFLRGNIMPSLTTEGLPSEALKLLGVSFLPAFLIIATMMTTVGAMVGDHREGQMIASLFFLPVYIPFAFYIQIVEHPHSPLALALSFFPLTTPVTLSMRHALDPVPAVQIVLILTLQAILALGSLWLAGYIWRLGMLQYGRRLTWREMLRKGRR
jgi:ABC-2 type transport system permease protein